MIVQTMGVGNLRQLSAHKYSHFLFLFFAVSSLLLLSTQPAMAQFKIINVKNAPYFAKGDGVTDDSTAIQQAVNAATASPGSTVYFPNGTYFHATDIDVNANRTTLRGQNRAQTLLTGSKLAIHGSGATVNSLSTSTNALYEIVNATRVAVNNCTIAGRTTLTAVTDCKISNCEFVDRNYQDPALSINGCARVEVSASQLSDSTTTIFQPSAFLVTTANSNDITIRQSKFVISNGVATQLDFVNRALIENCNFENVNFSYQIVSYNSSDLTVRGNNFTQTRIPSHEGFGWFGSSCTNLFASNNRFSNLDFPMYWAGNSGQILGNSFQDNAYGPALFNNFTVNVSGNRIVRCQETGIYSVGLAGYGQTFSRNIMRDCGLRPSSEETVLYISSLGGGNQAILQNNLYSGNTQNLQYFIRCQIPAPPAVVRGNITTTMLQTRVGP